MGFRTWFWGLVRVCDLFLGLGVQRFSALELGSRTWFQGMGLGRLGCMRLYM